MPRTGLLVGLATLLIMAAVAVLVWTNFLQNASPPVIPPVQQPPSSPSQPSMSDRVEDHENWIRKMAEMATGEGLAFSFADSDVTAWSITPGHKIERFSISGGKQALARLSSAHPLNQNDKLSGLKLTLPVEWAQKVNGKRFEIGVVARQPQSNAATDFSFLYATLQEGNSGWRTYKLSPQFQSSKFNFDVPLLEGGYQSAPVVVIRADSTGQDKAVEIVGVYMKLVDRPEQP